MPPHAAKYMKEGDYLLCTKNNMAITEVTDKQRLWLQDSLSTTELDIGGQSEALRVSPSQVLTSPSLFQQGLPDTGENYHSTNAAGQGTVAPSKSTASKAQNGTAGNFDISIVSKQDTVHPTAADATVAQNAVPLTLGNITLYKWTDENGQPKSLRILEEISSRWTEAGDLLGLCPARLEGIEEHRLRNARSCCRDVLHDWIQDNQGSYPVSWEGLICLLTDVKLTILAKELENALRTRSTL